jgi:hypothetical protein
MSLQHSLNCTSKYRSKDDLDCEAILDGSPRLFKRLMGLEEDLQF